MKLYNTIATALVLTMAGAGLAVADSDHGHGFAGPIGSEQDPAAAGKANMMQEMMPMMLRMHAQMMGGAMMGSGPGGMGAMDGAMMSVGRGEMEMMDGAMMRMMMGPDMMGAMTPETGRKTMLARLEEFDKDGDGTLSLAEFEALYLAMTREVMVRRFQYLDADGDAKISEAEMGRPALRMEMNGSGGPMSGTGNTMNGPMDMMDGSGSSGN